MKTKILILSTFLFALSIVSCKKEDNSPEESNGKKSVTFNFKAKANQMSDFMDGMLMFQNANGDKFGITKLKYLISDIILHHTDGTKFQMEGYHLIDVSDQGTLSFTPSSKIKSGNYDHIEMVFGLTPENNISFSHTDLNLENWNWPDMIGGGYHFMQLEGKFIASNGDTLPYQTHLGPTIDPNNTSDTLNNEIHISISKNFAVPQLSSHVSIDIEMNIDEWYENPNTIDLNQYGAAIMMNYDAQMLFYANGANGVFSIGNVSNN